MNQTLTTNPDQAAARELEQLRYWRVTSKRQPAWVYVELRNVETGRLVVSEWRQAPGLAPIGPTVAVMLDTLKGRAAR